MARSRRLELETRATLANREQVARLGRESRASRKRRHLTQAALAERAGVAQSAASRIECGDGDHASVDTWQRIAVGLERPIRMELGPDTTEAPSDVGHLALQELLLRLGRGVGYAVSAEVPSRPGDPDRSIDVVWRHDGRRLLLVLEVWNTIGDLGAAARSFDVSSPPGSRR